MLSTPQHAVWFSLLILMVTPLSATDLPVTAVTLYKHGIGLFERQGTVPAGETVQLHFETDQMNDLLKSLLVTDSSGSPITAIRYDANETLAQRLSKFPFQMGERQPLSVFLDTLKGSKVEIALADRTTSGTIVGARELSTGTAPAVEQLTLLTDNGAISSYELGRLSSIRLLDPHQQDQFKTYLQTLGDATVHDSRNVFIEGSAKAARTVQASYIAPAAIWKSSYRLNLNGAPTLEGWAIVDNTTSEDWNSVHLAVVSGRPISFISPLDTARYGNRQIAELPEDHAAVPVVYSGALNTIPAQIQNGLVGGAGGGLGPGAGGGQGGGSYRVDAKAAPAQSSVARNTAGATLGELFEYSFATPITIKKNQSAMLPFLQDKIQARKLLIYTERDSEHPVNAAELTNTSGKTLDGGPVTVYDGGAYAGEALFETLKASDKRLIGYAVDYGTRITTAYETGTQQTREIHIQNGLLKARAAVANTTTYSIVNVDSKAKTLLVQQNANDKSILSPKPVERTASAYRFGVKIPASGSQILKVQAEETIWSTVEVLGASPEDLLVYVENRDLPAGARTQLGAVQRLKSEIAGVAAARRENAEQIKELTTDQMRQRANIDSLNRVSGQDAQVRAYSVQLAATETQIATLRSQSTELATRESTLQKQALAAIEALSF